MRQIQISSNPQLALQQILSNNPNAKMLADLIRLSNGNLQQTAQYIAKQKGVNLNNLIQELQQ